VHADRDHYRSFEAKIRLTSPTFVPETETGNLGPIPGMTLSNSPPRNLHDVRKVIKRCSSSESAITGDGADILIFVLNSTITWELPHNIPFEAKQILIKEYIDCWKQPSFSCFHGVFDFLSDFVESLVEIHFGRFKNLERHVR
jgi:vacuolar protein sorting-associated protein 1